jgi:hypothetical protein
MALHAAEVWVTDHAELVVTIPYPEHDSQSETELRERLFRAVNHRFVSGQRDVLHGYLQSTQTAPLQIIEDSPDMHLVAHQYGVVLMRPEVRT